MVIFDRDYKPCNGSIQVHSVSALPSSNRAACAACVYATFLLMFCSCTSQSKTTDAHALDDFSMDSRYSVHYPARTEALYTQSLNAPRHHFLEAPGNGLDSSLHQIVRISISDLQERHALEQSFQIAAFQQFDDRKTAELYNVSASTASSAIVQAMRLRAGSLRRYGVTINQFIIPRGCQVTTGPERVLFVYSQVSNRSLFGNLPEGYVLASPVLTLLVYDALNLGSSQPAQQLALYTAESPIVIRFSASGDLKCASFAENSTDVSYTDLVQGTCQVNGTGVFALVGNASTLSPSLSPSPPPSPALAGLTPLPRSRSNTWKIVVGAVVGGLALLALLSLLALFVAKHRKKEKFAKMDNATEHGETLQTTNINNSRVPVAGSTRTPSMIEREYSV